MHVVILAGGAGERFWPASRSARPKHFLRVVGEQTLLEGTLERARRCTSGDRIWIVGVLSGGSGDNADNARFSVYVSTFHPDNAAWLRRLVDVREVD